MKIGEKAFYGLYPNKELKHDIKIEYSGKFSSYNANVKYTAKKMIFGLSKDWKEIDDDIVIGLLQSLMVKVFKTKWISTTNLELYNLFIKNLHIAAPKKEPHSILKDSFDRVNDKYFIGMVDKTNIKWGKHSIRKLGSYDYHTDTITISRIFKHDSQEAKTYLDYIMFHEILHKLHKFKVTNGRSLHHSKIFKEREKEFENSDTLEKNLGKYIKRWKLQNQPTKRKKLRFF